MYGMGFSPDMVEKAIQELGEGVPHDSLMEYLLFINEQRQGDQQYVSTSISPPRNGDISTLQKLTTEFQFPSAAVEKAMSRCGECPITLPKREISQSDTALFQLILLNLFEASSVFLMSCWGDSRHSFVECYSE